MYLRASQTIGDSPAMQAATGTSAEAILQRKRRALAVFGAAAVAVALLLSARPAASQDIEWTRQFGTDSFDEALAVATDGAGFAYVAGHTRGEFPGQTTPELGWSDPFLAKYDAAGNQLWLRQFGTDRTDEALAVTTDSAGYVYVGGQTDGTFPEQAASGGFDAFVAKYDGDGNQLWLRQFGTSADDAVRGLATDESGGVHVAGSTGGAFPGETSSGGIDAFIARLDADGNQVWLHQFGTAGFDIAIAISAAPGGGSYLAGRAGDVQIGGFVAKFAVDGSPLWLHGVNCCVARGVATDPDGNAVVVVDGGGFAGANVFVAKYDGAGDQLWMSEFGTISQERAGGVVIDAAGNAYVAGATEGTLPGETQSGPLDPFVAKFDRDGNQLWARQFGTNDFDDSRGVAMDGIGSLYVAGWTRGAFPGQTKTGVRDPFLAKLAAGEGEPAQEADLAITKSADPDPATIGESLTYTIGVENLGPGDATGVLLIDTLPESVDFVSAPFGCIEVAGTVTCDLGTLEAGAVIQVEMEVIPTAAGVITNVATVTANEDDPDLDNNESVVQTMVIDPDGLQVTDLTDSSLSPEDLGAALAGTGVTIDPTSVRFTGDERAGGAFTGGAGIIGFESGVILSSGQVVDVVGPNQSPSTTTAFGTPGDPDLTELAGVATFDAAILEFEFEVGADAENLVFSYVFGSEEYNEFVSPPLTGVNDSFAFWVNGQNCATVPNPEDPENPFPVSITTVNNGQPGVEPVNPHLYVNNDPFNPDSTGETVAPADLLNTEMDGLTVVLACEAEVTAGTNTMRMAIADGGDSLFDSWVLIKAGSLTTGEALEVTKTADPTFDRTFEWDIDKSVEPDEHSLGDGQSGTSDYTVTVTRTGFSDSNHSVSGTITITNPSAIETATMTGVTDTVSGDIAATVDCDDDPSFTGFPHLLEPGATLVCTYHADLPDGATRMNTATVATTGPVAGGSATVAIDFEGVAPTNTTNATVTVSDSLEGDLGAFSAAGEATYSRTFTCGEGPGEFQGTGNVVTNTAAINETGQSATATVTINCIEEPPQGEAGLEVAKSATPQAVSPHAIVRYEIIVTNDGPDPATGVTLTDSLPAGTTFRGATPSQGECTHADGTVTCSLGTLEVQATTTVTIDVTAPSQPGETTNTVTVAADQHDPDQTNNTATVVTLVLDPDENPDQASGFATGDEPTTIQTAPDGIQFSILTVPAGVSGPVTMLEETETECGLPEGFACIGQRLDLTAPQATADNPLVLRILVDRSSFNGTPPTRFRDLVLFHEPDEGDQVQVPPCSRGTRGIASPEPTCLAHVRNVVRDGVRYVEFLVYTADNGSWRPGAPR